MPVRDLVVLLNSPNRNAKVERALQTTREALETALDQVGNALGTGRADELKRLLRVALNLSRARGAYEGLCEGRRLHEFKSRIEGNPRLSCLTNRIRQFPQATGKGKDSELCRYMDAQVMRLETLTCGRIDDKEKPLPLESWGTQTWVEALQRNPSAVSKYISCRRKEVLSKDYTFLLAWERIGKSGPGRPKKDVNHRDLHLDKLYDWGGPKSAR